MTREGLGQALRTVFSSAVQSAWVRESGGVARCLESRTAMPWQLQDAASTQLPWLSPDRVDRRQTRGVLVEVICSNPSLCGL